MFRILNFLTSFLILGMLTGCLEITLTEKGKAPIQSRCFESRGFYESSNCVQELRAHLADLETDISFTSIQTIPSFSGSWAGLTLAKNGNLYALPYRTGTNSILKFDPRTQVSTLLDDVGAGTDRYPNSVLAKNGKIYSFSERGSPIHILEFDPNTETHRKITIPGITSNCIKAFHGTAMSLNGMIYGIPACARRIVSFNPDSEAFSLIGPDLSTLGGATYRWVRSVTTFEDKIIGTPHYANRATETPQLLEIDGATGTVTLTPVSLVDLQRVGSPLEANSGTIASVPVDGSSTKTTLFSNSSYTSGAPVTVTDYWVTVKALNGKGYTIGSNGRAYEIDLELGTLTDLGATGLPFTEGGALAPDGNIYFVPFQGDRITKVSFSGTSSIPIAVLESPFFNNR